MHLSDDLLGSGSTAPGVDVLRTGSWSWCVVCGLHPPEELYGFARCYYIPCKNNFNGSSKVIEQMLGPFKRLALSKKENTLLCFPKRGISVPSPCLHQYGH